MLKADVIEPSNSPWSAPVVMVTKKDGTQRFCIDYRKLNDITKKDVYPLPRCADILETLSGTKYFTHLDLVRGYWQIRVKEEDKEKTAFFTSSGHFQFKRMPFGLTNAPATFQRVVNTIMKGLTWGDCLVYLDDIVIFAQTLEEHNRKLDQVLTRLEDTCVKLNAKKCELLQEKCLILGHAVSEEGVSTDPDKIKVVLEWPAPKNVSALRSFLGCAGYYRQFISSYAQIASPLHDLERKDKPFIWCGECQNAIDELKCKLTTAPILAYPQFGKPFTLDTDASDKSIGAVLPQIQDGKERVVTYAAKALSKGQRNYSTTKK